MFPPEICAHITACIHWQLTCSGVVIVVVLTAVLLAIVHVV